MCSACADLFGDLAVKVDGEENSGGAELKEENTDNASEHGSDITEAIEAKSDFDDFDLNAMD